MTAKAAWGWLSAPSTLEKAAAFMTRPGRCSAMARSTCPGEVMSAWERVRPIRLTPLVAGAAKSSRPSMPPAPNTNILY